MSICLKILIGLRVDIINLFFLKKRVDIKLKYQ